MQYTVKFSLKLWISTPSVDLYTPQLLSWIKELSCLRGTNGLASDKKLDLGHQHYLAVQCDPYSRHDLILIALDYFAALPPRHSIENSAQIVMYYVTSDVARTHALCNSCATGCNSKGQNHPSVHRTFFCCLTTFLLRWQSAVRSTV